MFISACLSSNLPSPPSLLNLKDLYCAVKVHKKKKINSWKIYCDKMRKCQNILILCSSTNLQCEKKQRTMKVNVGHFYKRYKMMLFQEDVFFIHWCIYCLSINIETHLSEICTRMDVMTGQKFSRENNS